MALRGLALGLWLAALLAVRPPRAVAAECQFVLGFAALAQLVPEVGSCLEDQHTAASGDAQQHTSGGLLVWRRADNWTAFTDGYRTWVNGPFGVQQRLNSDLFPWELRHPGLQPLPGATPPAVSDAAGQACARWAIAAVAVGARLLPASYDFRSAIESLYTQCLSAAAAVAVPQQAPVPEGLPLGDVIPVTFVDGSAARCVVASNGYGCSAPA